MKKISAIILASGFSKRFGQNKLIFEYEGITLIERIINLVQSCDFYETILVISKENLHEVMKYERICKDGKHFRIIIPDTIKIIINQIPEKGLSQSVVLGTNVATGEGYFYFTVDQPNLTKCLIESMLLLSNSRNIVYPTYNGEPHSPTLFGAEFRSDLLQVKGDFGGRVVRDLYHFVCETIEVDDKSILMDIDSL